MCFQDTREGSLMPEDFFPIPTAEGVIKKMESTVTEGLQAGAISLVKEMITTCKRFKNAGTKQKLAVEVLPELLKLKEEIEKDFLVEYLTRARVCRMSMDEIVNGQITYWY